MTIIAHEWKYTLRLDQNDWILLECILQHIILYQYNKSVKQNL